MMQLKDKKILLCVSGGIAVFKAAALTSQLYKQGAEVKVMMTASAQQFVTPLTFQTMSRNYVYYDTFDEKDPEKVAHIDLADWADVVVVAPATANIIAKIANGIADDMISTTITATTAPILLAPAMNSHMYEHPPVKKNMQTLASLGYQFIEPGEGLLACGYVGKGRLAEPEEIILAIETHFANTNNVPLAGKKVLVTAGPTIEVIDPVRYFTNRSTGKMGFAIAEVARELGAEVTLVSGPTVLETPYGVNRINVHSAAEMYDQVLQHYSNTHIVVKSAAVADYRPKEVFEDKVKKQEDGELHIVMERTKDILAELGKQKQEQTLIGFAAESTNVEKFALQKLESKNLDMIVANNIKEEGSGFGVDTNTVTIFKRNGSKRELPMMTKREVAHYIFEEAMTFIQEVNQ